MPSNIKAGQIARYIALPGVVPRARRLFSFGFGRIAFLMAQIYGLVRLLPPAHPYLQSANMGRFGIRHVIAEAANHLVLSRKNIDQILVFISILAGAALVFAQFALLAYGFIIRPVMAQSVFGNPNPDLDIAFMLLDYVFGVPDLFNSCVATGASTCPENFQKCGFSLAVSLRAA